MSDLESDLDKLEEAKDALAKKTVSILGYRISYTGLVVAGGVVSSAIGALYAGFLMYQKVEEVANLDVGGFEQRMELIDQKIDNQDKLLTSIETNLRDVKQFTYDIEKRVNDKLIYFEGKLAKSELKMEMGLEKMEDRIQKALDNPLAN
jgi:hypothetical protein